MSHSPTCHTTPARSLSQRASRRAVLASSFIATLAVCSLSFAKNAAAAEPSPAREGFYLRFASGPSFASLSGDGPKGSASLSGLGSLGTLSLGGSVARGLVVAGTLQGATLDTKFTRGPFANGVVSTDGASVSASHRATAMTAMLGVLLDWYPRPRGGWHTGLSAGIGALNLENHADDSRLIGLGGAGSLFGGYDAAIARDWSLGLQLVVASASSMTLKNATGRDESGYRLTPVSVGLQASVLYF